jgi:hypothetical protein
MAHMPASFVSAGTADPAQECENLEAVNTPAARRIETHAPKLLKSLFKPDVENPLTFFEVDAY